MAQGIEIICLAKDCRYNERPLCKKFKLLKPIVILEGGRCKNYKTWPHVTLDEKEDKK